MQKYYQLIETEEPKDGFMGRDVYTKDGKFYTLSWGHEISTPGPDGKSILNTDIPGVIAAKSDEDAIKKFGVEKVEPKKEEK